MKNDNYIQSGHYLLLQHINTYYYVRNIPNRTDRLLKIKNILNLI